jgi:CheY-like chemotaxis protein
MLAPTGCRVLRAASGREGIDRALNERPDLILLDLMMPEVTGFDVVDALRDDPAVRDIPVIVVTAKDITDEDKAQLNGRVAAIVQKGTFSRPELIEWLRRVIPRAVEIPEVSVAAG